MRITPIVLPDDHGIRPITGPTLCSYCKSSVGTPHNHDCATVRRKIHATLLLHVWGYACLIYDFVDLVPAAWDVEQLHKHYNLKSTSIDKTLDWVALLTGDQILAQYVIEIDAKGLNACKVARVCIYPGWKTDEFCPQNLSSQDWREQYLNRST